VKKLVAAATFFAVISAASAFALTSGQVELLKKGSPKDVQAALDRRTIDIAAVSSFELDPGNSIEATAIFLAAFANPDPAVLEVLVRAGADVNARGPGGRSPLMLACIRNTTAVVR
jgi:ankyrin repeat protein